MYKVILVDDERWILAGLQAMIDWASKGFEVCATASNGIEVDQLVARHHPDLILADIRMPGCDGITMLKRLRQAGCAALFAIISGYAEFSYAQEAIRMGACSYLLKPVEENDLLALLDSARAALDEKYEKLLLDELDEATGRIDALYPEGCHVTVVYGHPSPSADALSCRISKSSRLYLSRQPLFQREEDIPTGLRIGTCRYSPQDGIPFSEIVSGCREASWQSFVHPKKRLFTPGDLPSGSPAIEWSHPISQLIQDCRANLDRMTVRRLYALYLAVQGSQEDIQPDTPECLLEQYRNAADFLDNLEAMIAQSGDPAAETISAARYMQDHFNENISLETIAQALSISTSSVKRSLLRECNDSFQHYLVKLRMEYAAKLLRNADCNINDIAYSCGFRDVLYFRRVFKKWFGVNPSDYKDAQ